MDLCKGALASKSDRCESEAEVPDLPLGPPECEEWPFHLQHWHGSMWDPIYALGASGWNRHVRRSHCEGALRELRRIATSDDCFSASGDDRKLPDADRAELEECIVGLSEWLDENPAPHPSFVGPFCRPGRSGPFYKDGDGWLILRRGPVYLEPGSFPSRTVLRMRPCGDYATHVQAVTPEGPDHFWGHYSSGELTIVVTDAEHCIVDSREANADFEARVARDRKRG